LRRTVNLLAGLSRISSLRRRIPPLSMATTRRRRWLIGEERVSSATRDNPSQRLVTFQSPATNHSSSSGPIGGVPPSRLCLSRRRPQSASHLMLDRCKVGFTIATSSELYIEASHEKPAGRETDESKLDAAGAGRPG
jgi:hypothetical protein